MGLFLSDIIELSSLLREANRNPLGMVAALLADPWLFGDGFPRQSGAFFRRWWLKNSLEGVMKIRSCGSNNVINQP